MSTWSDLPDADWWDSVSFNDSAAKSAGAAVGGAAGGFVSPDVAEGMKKASIGKTAGNALGKHLRESGTSSSSGSGNGFSMSEDEMRRALKLAQNMLEDMRARNHRVSTLLQVQPPSEDPASTRYTKGSWISFGMGKTAINASEAYLKAYHAQVDFLKNLITKLEGALGIASSRDEEVGSTFKGKEGALG